jgi:hypothetical protein
MYMKRTRDWFNWYLPHESGPIRRDVMLCWIGCSWSGCIDFISDGKNLYMSRRSVKNITEIKRLVLST